jgi:hypothetical protein
MEHWPLAPALVWMDTLHWGYPSEHPLRTFSLSRSPIATVDAIGTFAKRPKGQNVFHNPDRNHPISPEQPALLPFDAFRKILVP